MASISLPATGTGGAGGLGTMAGIEARRLVRHPVFLIGALLAFGVTVLIFVTASKPANDPTIGDLLSWPVVPAFFIGLPSLVAMARLTRSTEAAVEAVGTAPGTEGRRTAALALACLVPFAVGVAWTAMMLAMAAAKPPAPQEWWFDTMPDWQVWSILVALGPVACLGGGLLGVLTGRWVTFPGAAAALVVAIVAVDLVAQLGASGSASVVRLWVPWAMFHSGTNTDGTQDLYAGNPLAYLGYVLCLCSAAVLVAIWHDKAARTRRLRAAIVAVVVAGLACLALAMLTGPGDVRHSDPIPYQVST